MHSRIVFDFDGVLMHSHQETMVTAYNYSTNNLVFELRDVPVLFQELFAANRSQVRNAGEMVLLADWCLQASETGDKVLTRQGLLDLASKRPRDERLDRGFFAKRREFYEQNREKWLDLNKPYQPLWDFLRTSDKELLLVTHKNRKSVLELTSHYGLRTAPNQIFSGDDGLSKSKNFEKLFLEFPASAFYFIDDNIRNLIELKANIDAKYNMQLMYAEWGYGDDSDISEALQAGISVSSQESVIALMKEKGLS